MTVAPRQRLFFALWPDDDTRQALARLARTRLPRADGRPIAAHNLHLTLAFLGSVDGGLRECVERAVESLSAPAFVLEFRRIGYWPRPQVLWTAPERTPGALTGLASMLRKALVACGYEPESGPFRAHVTLARKVRGPLGEATHGSIRWPVSEFRLVESQTLAQGARYRPLQSWPLG